MTSEAQSRLNRKQARDELAQKARRSLPHARALVLLQALEVGQQQAFVPLSLGNSFWSGRAGGLTLAEAKRAAEELVQIGLVEFDVASGVLCVVTLEAAQLIQNGKAEWIWDWGSLFLEVGSK